MLALRLTRAAHPAVQLRRLLVATASAGTNFLLLCALGYALGHPGDPGAALLRLAWCAAPLAATVYFALAVARADPGTKPRTGLSAIGLGPVRLMAVSATTTALSCTLGSMLALLLFLHLRGDLTGMPFDGAAAEALAADQPLPLPGALTLLTLVPGGASLAVVLALRPREQKAAAAARVVYGRFGAYRRTSPLDSFGAYGRFGRQINRPGGAPAGQQSTPPPARTSEPASAAAVGDPGIAVSVVSAVSTIEEPAQPSVRHAAAPDTADTTNAAAASAAVLPDAVTADGAPTAAPSGLPWGTTVLAAGLAMETYASRTAPRAPDLTFSGASPGVMAGWTLAAVGLALAGPGLTHLCGRLLQSARPGALRLLAGRILMTEATRIGRPLGVVCAVLSATYAMVLLHAPDGLSLGPLTLLGVLLVTGCTVATLLTAAVEARQARADTTSALLRLGAPATMLRSAAALRAGALLALFAPLTLTVAELAALPLAR
ncbi:hypothetical protein [Streptomyces sp. CA-179760]|uniref:hypothetical protein n=1 Tax=Streptomyces sp. CA-179760 TaxID=3240054 RepID=UPI003D8F730D